MNKIIIFIILIITSISIYFFAQKKVTDVPHMENNAEIVTSPVESDLTIGNLRNIYSKLTGSDIKIEVTLTPGSSFKRYIASYTSEGNKIYGLLTVPNSTKPASGWPIIIFNHGFIPPDQYRTTERYAAYMDAFSRNDYIVFKSDYRGHGESEGEPGGAYGSNDYTIDVLSAVVALKKYPDADPARIGMWGHSMGGFITLRAMVTSKDIKAGVIWGGVVGSYEDLLNNWRRRVTPSILPTGARRWRQLLVDTYGTPEQNPTFWNSISATSFLSDISGPLQLHHGSTDESVPIAFSEKLKERMEQVQKPVELFTYQGDDHNISGNLTLALKRSVDFFDLYLK